MRIKGNKPVRSRLPGQAVRRKKDRTKWVGDLLTDVTSRRMQMKFVVTTVWVEHKIVEAETLEQAYNNAEPPPRDDLSLSNFHVAAIIDADGSVELEEPANASGGLNYRQVSGDPDLHR